MFKQAPAPPDYKAAAEATARSARPDITTPYAQQRWEQGPDGKWRSSIGFTGGLADAFSSLQQQAGQAMATPFSFGQFGALQTGDQAREQAIQAAYGQAASRLDPMWNRREEQMRVQLANQGLNMNSEAARNATSQFNLGRNDAYTSALNSAIGQGTAAGSAAFNQNLAARQQAISEALKQRSMPLEQLQQMQGLLAMPGSPGGTDYLQAAKSQYGNELERFMNEQQVGADIAKGALSAIGSAVGSFGGPGGTVAGGSLGAWLGSLFNPNRDEIEAQLADLQAPVPYSF